MNSPDFITNSRAVERQAIANMLRSVAPGELLAYSAMTETVGSDVRAIRYVIEAARAEVREEDGIVFEAIRNEGLRRMTEAEVATIVPGRRRRKLHRQAVLGVRELATVKDRAALTPAERGNLHAGEALLGAIAAVSTNKALEIVKNKPDAISGPLPFAQTIEALRGIK